MTAAYAEEDFRSNIYLPRYIVYYLQGNYYADKVPGVVAVVLRELIPLVPRLRLGMRCREAPPRIRRRHVRIFRVASRILVRRSAA
jgi:hypothetical protein